MILWKLIGLCRLRVSTLIFFISSLFLVTALRASDCSHDSTTFRCVEYVDNYDGDTVTVNIPGLPPLFGKKISVRLKGIDTAEMKTKNQCEKDAARTTKKLVQNLLKNAKSIELSSVERDKYFRVLADVRVDGRSISEILIKNKLAVAYDGGTKKSVNWCIVAKPTNDFQANSLR